MSRVRNTGRRVMCRREARSSHRRALRTRCYWSTLRLGSHGRQPLRKRSSALGGLGAQNPCQVSSCRVTAPFTATRSGDVDLRHENSSPPSNHACRAQDGSQSANNKRAPEPRSGSAILPVSAHRRAVAINHQCHR